MDKLRGMETFIAVVESGSFTLPHRALRCRR
jgi:DNA-binding transcriptional LysR family regulator